MKKQLLVVILILASISAFAQLSVTYQGTKFTIPHFKDDSTQSFNSKFVTDSILPSIRKSKYDIEIRFNFYGAFRWLPNEGHCIVIRANKDSIFALDYFLRDSRFPVKDTGRVVPKYTTKSQKIVLRVRKLTPATPLTVLLQQLIDNHITDVPDNDQLIKQLENDHVALKEYDGTDCCTNVFYEIKVKNHFRNFSTNRFYQEYNTGIKQLQYEKNIDDIFFKLEPHFFF